MQSLGEILTNREDGKKRKTNHLWIIASKVASLTDTKPNRWLREVKKYEHEVNRALIDFQETGSKAKIPIALFLYLLNKHKRSVLTNSGK